MDHYDNAIFTFRGAGKAWLGPAGAGGLYFCGLVPQFEFDVEVDSGELPNATNPGGGVYRHYDRIKACKLAGEFAELKPSNAALLSMGAESTVSSGAVSGEALTVALGALLPTAHPLKTSVAPTLTWGGDAWEAEATYAAGAFVRPVTGAAGHLYQATTGGIADDAEPTWPTNGGTVTDGTVTWTDRGTIQATAGTDFLVTGAGLVIPLDSGLIEGAPIAVAYTKAAAWKIELGAAAQQVQRLIFDGYNADDGDRRIIAEFYRARFAPGKIAFLTDGYWSGPLAAVLEADATKTGTGISQYGRVLYYQP